MFWLATEDHDLEEVDQVSLLTKTSVETLRLGLEVAHAVPVGGVVLGRSWRLCWIGRASCWSMRRCANAAGVLSAGRWSAANAGGAFARLMARLFAEEGLIVMDAAPRDFHALGARTLRYAIEHAEELQAALDCAE